eukprot:3297433-Pyramimonas_sp.AAC.3
MVRSSTYRYKRSIGQRSDAMSMDSCNSNWSSMVAKPDPAVMPGVAMSKTENAPSTPMARASRYAARDRRRATRLKSRRTAAATMREATCCWEDAAAASAAKDAAQAARWAPRPALPNTAGRACAASQARATVARARIQMRMRVGKSPIG